MHSNRAFLHTGGREIEGNDIGLFLTHGGGYSQGSLYRMVAIRLCPDRIGTLIQAIDSFRRIINRSLPSCDSDLNPFYAVASICYSKGDRISLRFLPMLTIIRIGHGAA